MVLQIKLTADDLFHYNYYTAWASPEKLSYRRNYYLKSVGYSFVGPIILYLYFQPKNFVFFASIGIVATVIWGLAVGYFGITYSYKKRLRTFSENQQNNKYFTRTEVHFTDTGISTKDEDCEAKFSWTAIIKKAETDKYIYLYLSSVNALIIPKKILNDAEKRTLDELLNRNLSITAVFKELLPA